MTVKMIEGERDRWSKKEEEKGYKHGKGLGRRRNISQHLIIMNFGIDRRSR